MVMNNVSRCSGNVGYDSSKLSNETVEEGGLSNIRCSDKSNVHKEEKRLKNKDEASIFSSFFLV
jgi:hypothetical protein